VIPLILNQYAFQYLGKQNRFQIDGMSRMNRVIWNRLQGHGSARVIKNDFAGRADYATGRADQTEQG